MKTFSAIILIPVFACLLYGQSAELFKPNSRREISEPNASSSKYIDLLISESQELFEKGVKNIKKKELKTARSNFDAALFNITYSGVELDSNRKLNDYYLRLAQKISEYEQMYELSAPHPTGDEPNATVYIKPPPAASIEPTTAAAGQKPAQLKNGAVPIILKYFNDTLNDPYSARYVNWTKPEIKFLSDKPYWYVAVKFRAKNLYGAYRLAIMEFYIANNRIRITNGD